MHPTDLQEGSLLDLLLADDSRAALVAAMRGDRALTNRYDVVARSCRATAEQLRRLAALTAADGPDDLLDPLVAHPAMPLEVLARLCSDGRCVSALGHLAGPRSLLRQVVAEHGYSEAIVSLGCDLYADPAVSVGEFTEFLRAHCEHEPLLRALAHGYPSADAKEALCLQLLAERPTLLAVRFMARRLFGDPARDVATLAALLGRAPSVAVLSLLLGSVPSHPDKAALVLGLCAQHPAHAALLAEHATAVAIAHAADPTIEAPDVAALFAQGEPRVLAALAGNPRTPTPMLEELAAARGFAHAQTIRARAVEALRRRRREATGSRAAPRRP